METVTRRVNRHSVSVNVTREGGIVAFEGQVARSERELGSSEVGGDHDLLDGRAVATHVVGRVVDDVVIGAGAGERRALDIHVAQLAVVGGRGQPMLFR